MEEPVGGKELTPAELEELERLRKKLVEEGKVKPSKPEGGKYRKGD